MNVMVVEDSRAIRNLVTAYVEEMGFRVLPAEDGAAALDLFSQHSIDLILMDVEMPGINGFEVTRRMRARLRNDWLPIIFLSSKSSDQHFIDGIQAGGDAYLAKPVNGPVLQSMVRAMGRIAAMRDDLVKANKELERMAHVDILTDLTNRRGFMAAYMREWARSNRDGTPLSIVLIDIDYFKGYNDNYGHLEGDACLRRVARALANAVMRPADVVARFGGEEFVVLLPNTDLAGASDVAERLRAAVENVGIKHEFSSVATHVTISVGVAQKRPEMAPELLLSSADEFLYKAKERGRNNVCSAPD
ncbi:MAG: diguanylate cyclase [Hahellaceae bacterium]|nr:diguanylate cyclase [Hahellaceae bacterium]MCP5170510.1 diguanylate cyclase [Hahellaceae bacterium]